MAAKGSLGEALVGTKSPGAIANADAGVKEDRCIGQTAVSDVARMFNGRSVFITGASGFIGRVLLEKLLRCYAGIKRIYILMRVKKDESPEVRLHKRVLNVPLFDKIRSMDNNGDLLNKIVLIHGDIGEQHLGISDADMKMMLDDETLSIVFHVAATVRFDEPLKKSVIYNLTATKSIVDFGRKLKNLISICHVSTAYVNSHFPEEMKIEEKLYPINLTPQQVMCVAEQLDTATMQHLKPHLVDKRPNTYTYTKALAEHLVAIEAIDLPVAIVRPTIVAGAWKEPLVGWVDNLSGANGMLVAISKGVLRSSHTRNDCAAEIVPVDVTVNTLIAAAYYVANNHGTIDSICENPKLKVASAAHKEGDNKKCNIIKTDEGYCPEKHPPIFHINTCDLNRFTWGDQYHKIFPIVRNYPSVETYRYPFGSFKHNYYHDLITRLFVHYLPALILDGICLILGKKRQLLWIYGKLHTAVFTMNHFTLHDYKFETKNKRLLEGMLNEYDLRELFMDIENLDWQQYYKGYTLGMR